MEKGAAADPWGLVTGTVAGRLAVEVGAI